MRYTRLQDWLDWLQTGHLGQIALGLERVSAVAARLDVRHPARIVVKVAGTNGKGSCVAMLASILTESGYRVGAYTSPVIDRFDECLAIDGERVDERLWLESLAAVDEARGDESLTGFEFQTLAAAHATASAGVDVALMEIGLGGARDAVNALDADAVLLTAIDVDHTDWLGPTRESVAREKAGVLAPGVPAVCADRDPPECIVDTARRLQAPLALRGHDFDAFREGDRWRWEAGGRSHRSLPLPGIMGAHQMDNAAGVLAVLEALSDTLPVRPEAIASGLDRVSLSGRQQVLAGEPWRMVDVAHNVQSARALARTLADLPPSGRTHLVLGVLRDKDANGIVAAVSPCVDAWYLADVGGARGAPAARLRDALHVSGARGPVSEHAGAGHAWSEAMRCAVSGDRVVACGSFLVARDVLRVEGSRG